MHITEQLEKEKRDVDRRIEEIELECSNRIREIQSKFDNRVRSLFSIPLSQGKFSIVDPDVYEIVSSMKWWAYSSNGGKTYYATRLRQALHRFIMSPPKGMVVDHINHNGLDNRRCNLRVCTPRQNMHNSPRQKISTNRYKGVWFRKKRNRWAATISTDGKKTLIGFFKTEEDAARAYDRVAKERRGEFAYLNFPNE